MTLNSSVDATEEDAVSLDLPATVQAPILTIAGKICYCLKFSLS